MSQSDYERVRQIEAKVEETGTIGDDDLSWMLAVMQGSANSIMHARVMGVFVKLKSVTPSQKSEIVRVVTPLQSSSDRLDTKYASDVLKKMQSL
jgi:hypothetical protein